jgi:acyl-CoA thioesterase
MSQFDDDIRVAPIGATAPSTEGAAHFSGRVQPHWNIGANPNGGYLLALVGAALRQATPEQPDALSITAHYLLPGLPDAPCRIDTQVLRRGRQLSTVRATLWQEGGARLEVLASMGVLQAGDAGLAPLGLPRPDIPPPQDCIGRSAQAQRVALPILSRLEVRLHPDEARQAPGGRARVTGWTRFADGRAPDALACLLMTDVFPPAVFGHLGMVGWVPTVALTVQLRRPPAPGWLLGQFHCHDLCESRLVEDGALWDEQGQLVAQARQLALVRLPAG